MKPRIKISRLLMFVMLAAMALSFLFWPMALFGQTNDPGGGGVDPAPVKVVWMALVIPVLVPIVIAVLKGLIPKIPLWVLPILAPLIGAGSDIALYYAGLPAIGNPALAAALGSAGVGFREIYDQAKKRYLPAPL